MATIQQLQAKAINTGKSIDAKRFIRAKLAELHGDDAERITNDMIGETLTKMPGNIGDDSHISDVLNVLAQVLKPSETLKTVAGLPATATATVTADISAMIDKTPQRKLADTVAAALPPEMLAEMEADYQATMQGKAAPFHCLRWLQKTFGPDANSNQFKDTLKTWPIVDSQSNIKAGKTIEVEVVFVSRFENDMPAKYQVLNKQTSKFIDFDFYNVLFDDTPAGVDVNERISKLEKRIVDLGGSTNNEEAQLKTLKSERTNKRKQLKDAMRAYQQVEAFNAIPGVVCVLNIDKATDELVKGAPVYFYEKDAPINARPVDMASFLSYRPEQAKDFASLLTSKPSKKKRSGGSGTGKTGSDAQGTDVKMPGSVQQAEAYLAMFLQWMDNKANQVLLFKEGEKNKPLRDSVIMVHALTENFYKKNYKAWQEDQQDPSRDVA